MEETKFTERKFTEKRFDCVIYSKDKRDSYNIYFICYIDYYNNRGCVELFSDDIRLQKMLKFENRDVNLISEGYVRLKDLGEIDDELLSNAVKYFYREIGKLEFSELNIKVLFEKMLLWLKRELDVIGVYEV